MTRGLLIAAPRSGGGKTTLTLGLMRAFRQQGRQSRRAQIRTGLYRSGLSQRAARARQLQSRYLGDGRRLLAALAGQAAQDADAGAGRRVDGPVRRRSGPAGANRRLRRCRRRARPAGVAGARRLGAGADRRARSPRAAPRLIRASTIAGVVLNKIGSRAPSSAGQGGDRGAAGLPVVGALPRAGRDRTAGTPPRPRAGQRNA